MLLLLLGHGQIRSDKFDLWDKQRKKKKKEREGKKSDSHT